MLIVSACLANLHCRYDGGSKSCEAILRLVAEGQAIPVCPEQLGGLPTPRLPAERIGDKIIRKDGTDVSAEFMRGAQEALHMARLVKAKAAILKARSPSCGFGKVYDGSFTGRVVNGNGVFAELCQQAGMEVITEEEMTDGKYTRFVEWRER